MKYYFPCFWIYNKPIVYSWFDSKIKCFLTFFWEFYPLQHRKWYPFHIKMALYEWKQTIYFVWLNVLVSILSTHVLCFMLWKCGYIVCRFRRKIYQQCSILYNFCTGKYIFLILKTFLFKVVIKFKQELQTLNLFV